jgi:hypothetical protein
MITVKEMMECLSKMPPDAVVYGKVDYDYVESVKFEDDEHYGRIVVLE